MKSKVYHNKWICILLSAVIILGAFSVQKMTAGTFLLCEYDSVQHKELFSHNLLAAVMPMQEQQSVRESLAEWQSSFLVRENRPSETRNTQRNELQHELFVMLLLTASLYIMYMARKQKEPSRPVCENIVCYIHNQDGEKD